MTHGISALTGFMKNAGVAGVFVYGFFEKFLYPHRPAPFRLVPLPAHPDWRHAERGWSGGLRHPGHIPRLYAPSRPDAGHERRITFFAARDDHYLWLAGASLAFYHTAKPEKKAMAKAILLPAIITSMLTGITEPIEFTFLFVSPLLWVIHATLTAASQAICDIFTVRPWGASG